MAANKGVALKPSDKPTPYETLAHDFVKLMKKHAGKFRMSEFWAFTFHVLLTEALKHAPNSDTLGQLLRQIWTDVKNKHGE